MYRFLNGVFCPGNTMPFVFPLHKILVKGNLSYLDPVQEHTHRLGDNFTNSHIYKNVFSMSK